MLLAIDVGNTNIVFACMEGHRVVHRWRMTTERGASAARYIERMTAELGAYSIDGAILGSVVPETDAAICTAVKEALGCKCMVVTPSVRTDMPIMLEHPESLAADIIAGCVGAMAGYPLPLAVVDMGTATTIVVVDREGHYRGGAIAAGLKLSLRALVQGTSLLPNLDVEAPEKCIATETVEAMCSGAVFGAAAMLDGMIDRMEKELGETLTAVATGGISALVQPHCVRTVHYEPDLLLKGLANLYEKNVNS